MDVAFCDRRLQSARFGKVMSLRHAGMQLSANQAQSDFRRYGPHGFGHVEHKPAKNGKADMNVMTDNR